MSKIKKPAQHSNRPPRTALMRWILPLTAVLLALAAGVGFWWTQRPPDEDSSAVAPAAKLPAGNQAAPASAPGFAKLQGRWLRPDGGYILEIRSVAADGKMDATYNNPKSIHVAKAEASQAGTALKVFVELRDVNYPGSTYTLTYAADTDQFTGIYYQAAMQQQFEVTFVRAP